MFEEVEVMINLSLLLIITRQDTDRNVVSGGVSVELNITVPPTAAFRGPSGNTPAPLVKPGGDSYMLEKD